MNTNSSCFSYFEQKHSRTIYWIFNTNVHSYDYHTIWNHKRFHENMHQVTLIFLKVWHLFQVIVAFIRGKWTSYSIDWWNLLDWLLITVYTTGMLLKFPEGPGYRTTSKLLLISAFMALCTRLLHLACMTEFLGRKLVINRKMVCCITIDWHSGRSHCIYL